jgi:glutamate-1-semialdehyde 2,1-aminomutase
MKSRPKSSSLFKRAKQVIPGGVNSPVRAYGSVGGEPPFIAKGKGAYIYDADGNEYVDYVLSWGPMILGHAHPAVVEAVREAADSGTSFGAPTEAEVELAELVKERMPHVELLRLVNSGTEAVMTAARLARGYTGRDVIVKFDGCYHGHSDGFLVAAGSGLATGGLPGSAGVPGDITRNTLSLLYNDLEQVEDTFKQLGEEIAAVIVEPVAANMGVVLPRAGFLEGLRDITEKHGALLIFDEVITGFRVSKGGATELLGVTPDLMALGKVIGGGMPIGALGGRKAIMERLAPVGNVYQAGTLSGNPISVAAGLATLRELGQAGVYEQISQATGQLASGLHDCSAEAGVPVQINNAPGLLTVFFSTITVQDFNNAQKTDTELFRKFFYKMLEDGINIPPSSFEAWFLSIEHNQITLERTLSAAKNALKKL